MSLARLAVGVVLGFTIINVVAAVEPVPPTGSSDLDFQSLEERRVRQMDRAAASGVTIPSRGFRVLRHELLIDVPRNQAVFQLWFSARPDFFEFDQYGRQRHSFQHYVQMLYFGDFYRVGERLPQRPLLVVRSGEVRTGEPFEGKVVVRDVDPLSDPPDEPESGGWGPKVAEVPLRQEGRRIRFSVPLSVFDYEDGFQPYAGPGFGVHYYLEAFTFGAANLELLQGLATVAGTEATIIAAPNNPDAPIHPTRKGPLVVDLITHPTEIDVHSFAEGVDLKSVRFGPNEIRPYRGNLIDIDGDGHLDLRLWFTTAKLGLGCLDNELWLVGEQWDGRLRTTFVGFDTVRIARCPLPE